MTTARLITIPFSHYCEKARWALDHHRIPYREEAHPPMIHWAATRSVGAGRTVPVLALPGGQVLAESADILAHADAHGSGEPLLPEGCRDEALALQARFDRTLGAAARRIFYVPMLEQARPLVRELFVQSGEGIEGALASLLFPALSVLMARGLKLDAAGFARSKDAADGLFVEIDALLADGRPYLCGDVFTAADLTLASLGAPLVVPPEYGYAQMPALDRLPPRYRALIDAYRATATGQHILRVYAEHRTLR